MDGELMNAYTCFEIFSSWLLRNSPTSKGKRAVNSLDRVSKKKGNRKRSNGMVYEMAECECGYSDGFHKLDCRNRSRRPGRNRKRKEVRSIFELYKPYRGW